MGMIKHDGFFCEPQPILKYVVLTLRNYFASGLTDIQICFYEILFKMTVSAQRIYDALISFTATLVLDSVTLIKLYIVTSN